MQQEGGSQAGRGPHSCSWSLFPLTRLLLNLGPLSGSAAAAGRAQKAEGVAASQCPMEVPETCMGMDPCLPSPDSAARLRGLSSALISQGSCRLAQLVQGSGGQGKRETEAGKGGWQALEKLLGQSG